jgi:hypothetical protein
MEYILPIAKASNKLEREAKLMVELAETNARASRLLANKALETMAWEPLQGEFETFARENTLQ